MWFVVGFGRGVRGVLTFALPLYLYSTPYARFLARACAEFGTSTLSTILSYPLNRCTDNSRPHPPLILPVLDAPKPIPMVQTRLGDEANPHPYRQRDLFGRRRDA